MAHGHSLLAHLGLIAMAAAFAPMPVQAATQSFTGSLAPADPNDVKLIEFTLASAATFTAQTWSFGGSGNAPGGTNAAGAVITAGGFDPYLSLFSGFGPGALFLASNDDGLCPPGTASPTCADSTLHVVLLAAGNYTLALSTFSNLSFAENLGVGTLGDGFVGFGHFDGRSALYALDIDAALATAIPEPAPFALLALGVAGLVLMRRFSQTRERTQAVCP